MPLAAQEWEDPGPLICLVPADPSPSTMAAPFPRVYGVSLGTHLQELGRDIALPIEACVMMLLSEGMKEEVGPTGAGREGASGPSVCSKPPLLAPLIPLLERRALGEGSASCCWIDSTSHLVMLLWTRHCRQPFTFPAPFKYPSNPWREPHWLLCKGKTKAKR